MTAARVKATGKGSLAWRVEIEGYPVEWVSHRDMVKPFNKDGVTGWSASSYYAQALTSSIAGSSTMTRSILLRLDTGGSTQFLFADDGTNVGWSVFLNASNQLIWRVGDGASFTTVASAALTVGEVYAATASFDGSNLRLVVNQTASTPSAFGGTFSEDTQVTTLGASTGGSNPASGCTILGAAATDTRALTDAEMQTHNAKVTATGVMQNLLDGEHLYRAPDLSEDLIGSADWTVNGEPTVDTVSVGSVDGKERKIGLKSDGFKFGDQVDLVQAEAKGQSQRVRIVNREAGAALFAKRATNRTVLGANATDATTVISVQSTTGFPSSGYIYVDSETIQYTGTTATGFTGCTRGKWKSLAQYHYIADGERLRYPEVTDHPVILEGRRVRFYAYGPGDDKQGDGSLWWTGIALDDASFDGLSWSFNVDSLYRVFDQDIGSDLKDPVPIRGIYYPASAPLFVRMIESATANASLSGNQAFCAIAGFWETQTDFVAALNTLMSTVQTAASFNQTIRAVERDDHWAFEFTASSTKFMSVEVLSPTDAFPGPNNPVIGPDGSESVSVTNNTTYIIDRDPYAPGAGTVPRAAIGTHESADHASSLSSSETSGLDRSTNPQTRVYLGGITTVTSNISAALFDWESTGPVSDIASSGAFDCVVVNTNSTSRYIDLAIYPTFDDPVPFLATATSTVVPTVRLGRDYGVGTLGDFITALASDTAEYSATGAVPFIRPTSGGVDGDFDLTNSEIDEAANGFRLTSRRKFTVFTEVSLGELIAEECKLLGVFPALSSSGRIVFKRLRLPSPTEVASATTSLTASNVITDDAFLSWRKGAVGLFNTVRYLTGYDPIEDDHLGPIEKVRDVSAFGQSPNSRVVEVAPFSRDPSRVEALTFVQLASRVLGVFGSEYAYVDVEVPLTLMDALVGDLVTFTWSKMPNSSGTLGVTNKIAIVVAREFTPMDGRGRLTLYTTDQNVGGYAPAGKITSISGASGGTSFTVTLSSDYFAGAETAADHWAAGHKVRLYQWGSTATSNNVTAEVDSVSGNDVTITTDSAWTHTGATWALGSQVSTAISDSEQQKYAYEAGSDGKVDFSGSTANAFTLGP